MTSSRFSLLCCSLAGAALLLVGLLVLGILRLERREQPAELAASGAPEPCHAFALVSTDGRMVTDETFRGRWELVYFGYTHCPDVCPTRLAAISDTLERLGRRSAAAVQPLFITLDPRRDDEPELADYLQHFDSRIVGLTGPQAEIDKVARQLGVAVTRHGADGSIDHDSAVLIIDPAGHEAGRFAANESSAAMAAQLAAMMAATS